MNEDNNERLAKYYKSTVMQTIIKHPYVWSHYMNGDWFLLTKLENNNMFLIEGTLV